MCIICAICFIRRTSHHNKFCLPLELIEMEGQWIHFSHIRYTVCHAVSAMPIYIFAQTWWISDYDKRSSIYRYMKYLIRHIISYHVNYAWNRDIQWWYDPLDFIFRINDICWFGQDHGQVAHKQSTQQGLITHTCVSDRGRHWFKWGTGTGRAPTLIYYQFDP